MNEEPKEKPIRELLQNISSTTEQARVTSRPLVNPVLVRHVTFFASLICLLLTTVAFLAMIWDLMDAWLAFRCIGTMIVVLTSLFIFRAINSQFN